MSFIEGPLALSDQVNRADGVGKENEQGIVSPLLPELTLDIDDDTLLDLAKKYTDRWAKFYNPIQKKQKDSERYWIGKQYSDLDELSSQDDEPYYHPLIDNIIFQSLETFLPIATKQNPEPVVSGVNEDVNRLWKQILEDLNDEIRLKLKVKQGARNWSLSRLGVAKIEWDVEKNKPCVKIIRSQKIVLDPDATVEDGVFYTGNILGEYEKMDASDMVKLYPECAEYITSKVEGNMATQLQFVKWCTPDYWFGTLDQKVLYKMKNPNWNYDSVQQSVDDYGQPVQTPVPGLNHFKSPQLNYVLLSVFNLGLHPIDDTSLVEQILPLQDLTNKRLRQIDRNADQVNGGWAISLDKAGLNKEEAADAVTAWREGGAVAIPEGDIREAIQTMQGTALPPMVYQQLLDSRSEMMNIFGVKGSTPEGIQDEKTVRGKIISSGSDDSRIGGGVTEYLEQFADQIYNQLIQLIYVFGTPEFKAQLVAPVKVTVKSGSMIPKDPLSEANEAIQLAEAGFMSPLTLFKRLEDPNPEETYAELLKWKMDEVGLAQTQATAQAATQNKVEQAKPQSDNLLKKVPVK